MTQQNDKYAAQKKHLRTKYKRLSIDFKPELLDAFKDACAKNNTTPSAEIKRFMALYVEQNAEG